MTPTIHLVRDTFGHRHCSNTARLSARDHFPLKMRQVRIRYELWYLGCLAATCFPNHDRDLCDIKLKKSKRLLSQHA
jgi:hypothetical protein